MTVSSEAGVASRGTALSYATRVFVKIGVLPVLVVAALVIFTLMSDHFLTVNNIHSALRQNSYIIIATLGQFIVLLTGGFDLSVGAITALVSVTTAMAMTSQSGASPLTAVLLGMGVGMLVGMACGLINGLGVASLNINPFIMTLATASVFSGLALMLTSGVPVSGMPREFSDWLGFANVFGVGVSIWLAVLAALVVWVLMTRTRPGRHIYAVGASPSAARLSGVNSFRTLLLAYVGAGALAAAGSVLLTARIETGEANIGASLPLQTIAAAVIGGVSLRGGSGRVLDAVLGAVFIGIVANGMNLAEINSYYQMIVTGLVLAFAVVADRLRGRLAAAVYAGKV
jgi:Ribose/xylose/arabinose/galactoside ABC-type transport systems, permease components